MSITSADLEQFQAFAVAKLNHGGAESMEELFDAWLMEHPSEQEQADTLAAIREGLENIEAGEVHDFDGVNSEIRKQYGWSSDQ